MANDDEYQAILRATYDYTPQSDDEISIKEDQLLLLIQRVDDEYVPVQLPVQHTAQLIPAGGRLKSKGTLRMMTVLLASFPLPGLNPSVVCISL